MWLMMYSPACPGWLKPSAALAQKLYFCCSCQKIFGSCIMLAELCIQTLPCAETHSVGVIPRVLSGSCLQPGSGSGTQDSQCAQPCSIRHPSLSIKGLSPAGLSGYSSPSFAPAAGCRNAPARQVSLQSSSPSFASG